MTLFRKKYRVESIRRPNWNYAAPGYYFITICTQERRPYFGTISDGVVRLSAIGKIAGSQWKNIPNHYDNVAIDEFVIMPNHLHGIVQISGPEWEPKISLHRKKTLQESLPKAGSIPHIMRCYKAGVTYWCKQNELKFGWQSGFHDRIIRGPDSLTAVREYIQENPFNWDKDEQNPEMKKGEPLLPQ